MQNQLRFAIFGSEYQSRNSSSIRQILSCLQQRGAAVAIDRTFYNFLLSEGFDTFGATPFDGSDFAADFVVSMGGDGTFLKAAARVGAKATPIIGVNMGRLGFLADILPSEASDAIDAVCSGRYRLERHSVIEAKTDGEALGEWPFALNDIAVLKRDTASMISIRTSLDGEFMVNYQADGLIVSTPTGSTAYGLSNGGPIMVPNAGILCLTPVAPHSLNIRPVVVADSVEIELTVESRSHNYLVAIDGRSVKLSDGTKLTIRRAPYDVNIVKLPNKRYYATLRQKMMWGADARG